MPPRIWTLIGAAILVFAIGWCVFAPDQQGTAPTPSTPGGAVGAGGTTSGRSPGSAVSPDAGIQEQDLIFIQAVRLSPSQPTQADILKTEVVVEPSAPTPLAYAYQWKVNEQAVKDEAGDTLNLSPFRKGDLITVTVTPRYGDVYGHAVQSPVVALHSAPPSLELKAGRLLRKPGEPVELQLVSAAANGSQVTFSLEQPLVPGMTIDARSGKISWLIQPDQKGPIRFGAAAEDGNQTKVTKTFEIALD